MVEFPTVASNYTRKARKTHQCCECRGQIQPGETYHVFRGLWDGEWDEFKTCPECHQLRKEVEREIKDLYEFPPFEQLYEQIFESRHTKPEHLLRFMATRRKRQAPESPKGWMEAREQELRGSFTFSYESLIPRPDGNGFVTASDPCPVCKKFTSCACVVDS